MKRYAYQYFPMAENRLEPEIKWLMLDHKLTRSIRECAEVYPW